MELFFAIGDILIKPLSFIIGLWLSYLVIKKLKIIENSPYTKLKQQENEIKMLKEQIEILKSKSE